MILTILGLIAIVVFARQVYREANSTGRNAVLWTVITCLVGFGFQFVLPVFFGIVYAVIMLAGGTAPEDVAIDGFGLSFLLMIVPLGLSLVGMFLVMRHVSTLRDDPPTISGPEPPPPPSF